MNRRLLVGLLSALALAPAAWSRLAAQTGPQAELPKEPLVVVTHDGKRHDFSVEMALRNDQQMTGLMFRTAVPPDGGMLFDWGEARPSQMWMKNTVSSLDMLFINADGTHPRHRRAHRAAVARRDRQRRAGAGDAGAGGGDGGAARYPGGRPGAAADLRECRDVIDRVGEAPYSRGGSGRGAAW